MICHQIRKHTTELIDRRMNEAQLAAFDEHIDQCCACRRHVDETRGVISFLRGFDAPTPPEDLVELTMTALDREAEAESSIVTRRHSRLTTQHPGGFAASLRALVLNLEFKLIAYSIGLVLSFGMFVGLLASMRPMMSLSPFVSEAAQNRIWMTKDEGTVLALTSIPGAYSLPRIARDGDLPEIAENVDFSSDDNLVLIAEIAPDGRGHIVEVLSGPHDDRVVNELAVAMNRPRSFIPSYAPTGMAVPTRVVLCFERVDIIG